MNPTRRVFVVFVRNIGRCAGLRLKLGRCRGSGSVGTIPLVQVGQNVGGFRQDELAVLEDRYIILAGYRVNLRAHASAVRHDDSVIGQPQVGQFAADYETVRAPVDMEKSHGHDGYKATRKRKKVKRPFWQDVEKVLQPRSPPCRSGFASQVASPQRLNVQNSVHVV
ncbi:hypothetical protein COMA2_100134 [Candidatus Nitrospira nitrificans]|uniref:Uncharacterized protein n=1 Tax=Candidatus Nitrospira nitrificans TaxID=1742973 RepID=A0A0S4L9M5_9BACT|nr:hypothetical protein COMA2_100134 [Candidatus Nitrospira nitrificans]